MKTKTSLLTKIQPYTKAVSAGIALLIPVVTAVVTALADGVVTFQEVIMIVGAVGALIGGTGAVYQFPNIPKEGK